jgi:methyl coenzyme M reductase subunit C-like uncharacterized protein (methanogenesis marker protein 7)
MRATSDAKLEAQMKTRILMLVSENAGEFRAAIVPLRSHGEGDSSSVHTFSLPEDRCVRLLLKNLGKRMPKAEIREELEALHINVQAVMQLRSKRRDHDFKNDPPLTAHLILSAALGPDVVKVRRVIDTCGLRLKVEAYRPAKWQLQCKRL